MNYWELGDTIHETFLLADSDGVRLAGLAVASIEAATRLYKAGALVGTFAALDYCSVTDLGDARYEFAVNLEDEEAGGEYDWFVDSDDFASLDGRDYQSDLHRVGYHQSVNVADVTTFTLGAHVGQNLSTLFQNGGVDSALTLTGATGIATSAKQDAQSVILARIAGLVQENFYIDNYVWSTGRCTSFRMRTYSVAASVGTAENVLATYNVTMTYTAGKPATYKVVKA